MAESQLVGALARERERCASLSRPMKVDDSTRLLLLSSCEFYHVEKLEKAGANHTVSKFFVISTRSAVQQGQRRSTLGGLRKAVSQLAR